MQQRHSLFIILAILMNASLHSMQQSLSLHMQAEQKQEAEIKSLDDTPEKTIKLFASNGDSLAFTESLLQQVPFFKMALEKDREAAEISIYDTSGIKRVVSGDPDQVTLLDLKNILEIIQKHSNSPYFPLYRYVLFEPKPSNKKVISLYYMAMYFDIQQLAQMLKPEVAKLFAEHYFEAEYAELISKCDPAWEIELAAVAYSNAKKLLDLYGNDMSSRLNTNLLEQPFPVTAVAISRDESIIASGNSAGGIVAIRGVREEDQDITAPFFLYFPNINFLEFSSDGKMLAVGAERDIRVYACDIEEQPPLHIVLFEKSFFNPIRSIHWSPDNKHLAIFAGHLNVVDITTPRTVYREDCDAIASAAFSPDGTQLAITDWVGDVRILDFATKEIIKTLTIEQDYSGNYVNLFGTENPLAWSPDGKSIARACAHDLRVWDVETGKSYALQGNRTWIVSSLAWSPDSKYIATGSKYGETCIWDVKRRMLLMCWGDSKKLKSYGLGKPAWMPNGKQIITPSADKQVKIWDIDFDVALTMPQIAFLKELLAEQDVALCEKYKAIYESLPVTWKRLIDEAKTKFIPVKRGAHVPRLQPVSSLSLSRIGIAVGIVSFGSWLLTKFKKTA